jgi:hypothetical protein
MVAPVVVGQSKRKKTRREQGKVFLDYVIAALNLSRASVLLPPAQFIPSSASSRGMFSLPANHTYIRWRA